MIIVAGHLVVAATHRAAYLAKVASVTRYARSYPGCLEFVQVADPIEPDRIHIFERWSSADALSRFRDEPFDLPPLPPVQAANIAEYEVR